MPIQQKHQLVDDEAVFKIEQLEGLNQKHIQALNKTYHTLSIIGSQSSGKSTLLNALFGTSFEELNRRKRVGQTTKGIWYSIDPESSMMILDIEGSDSFEREEDRTKIERRNCLFALAVSHTLLINLWIQQIGLYKGSQLSILQIILELNLRLFGSEQPKNIIFVVRDYSSETENKEGLKQNLFKKVEQAWQNIKKPHGKENVQLSDLFKLEAFFLASKVQDPEIFQEDVAGLRGHLKQLASDQRVISKNVAMSDVPQFMQNLWQTIANDKDVNLPQQKVLLSNMKCHQVKKQVYEQYEDQFRDQLEKSQRKMNVDFASNVHGIVDKIIHTYDGLTVNYHPEEAGKVREEFMAELERKIELSYSYQVKHIVAECLREFTDQVNKAFLKDKGIENIKNLKPQIEGRFKQLLGRVSYRPEWSQPEMQKFSKTLEEGLESQKQRLVVDSLKDFDRSIKKQIENLVSNAFYDKKVFCQNFWGHLSKQFVELEHRAKNSIVNLYKKLEFKPEDPRSSLSKSINEHIERARTNAHEQLLTTIKMKCNDLLYYMMRHFSVEFNLDNEGIPRQWVNMKPEQIKALYDKTKQKFLDMIANFSEYELQLGEQKQKKQSARPATLSAVSSTHDKQLMSSGEMIATRKKMQQAMQGQFQEALKKNKQVYMGAIPKWGWILFLVVAFDDILLWFSSPALAIPLTLILLVVAGVFFYGGSGFANSLVNTARRAATNQFGNLAAQATTRMMKNNS